MTNRDGVVEASFRDPSGFVFRRDGVVYRRVNPAYRAHYDRLHDSGLYETLVRAGQLVRHEEVSSDNDDAEGAYRILRPQQVPFVSYPYEWCFSAFKDAALATLDIQLAALARGMTLKDASAYNIQFLEGRPVLIDTLSFEIREAGDPWIAYRQFCQHFLAPLALMAHVDIRLGQLLRSYIDGIPLDLAARLLPTRSRINPSLLVHVHLHAASQKRYADAGTKTRGRRAVSVSERGIEGLVRGLRGAVSRLRWKPPRTEWADYYAGTNYTDAAAGRKAQAVSSMLAAVAPRRVWDLGANTGRYSRIAADHGASVVAFDVDPAAVEANYRQVKSNEETRLLPLLLDLANPSPGTGWRNRERPPVQERGRPDALLALALIHHLAISGNVPLDGVARLFRELGGALVVEFVPKSDSQVQRLLASREDIFTDYHREGFEAAFERHYRIEQRVEIPESERAVYLMRPRGGDARPGDAGESG